MELDQLLAEREIYRALVRFARAMDERDWPTLAALTTPDLKADFGTGVISGNAEVISLIRAYLDNCGTTQHMLGNVLIDVTGDTATSQAYVSDMHLAKDDDSDLQFRTLGDYSDKWRKVDGRWAMSHRVKNNRATLGSMDIFGG